MGIFSHQYDPERQKEFIDALLSWDYRAAQTALQHFRFPQKINQCTDEKIAKQRSQDNRVYSQTLLEGHSALISALDEEFPSVFKTPSTRA